MPQYLFLAETIYKKMKNEKLFSKDVLENMYILMKVIRKEIKGTEYKLKYNFIDFNEVLSKSKNDCKVKIDVSLIPSYNRPLAKVVIASSSDLPVQRLS